MCTAKNGLFPLPMLTNIPGMVLEFSSISGLVPYKLSCMSWVNGGKDYPLVGHSICKAK